MKLKLSEILNEEAALKKLVEKEIPVKVSYRISKLTNKLGSILKAYEENRNKLVKKYGTKNEDESFSVKKENLEEFYKEMLQLQAEEEEVDFEKLKIEDLGEINIAPKDLPIFLFE